MCVCPSVAGKEESVVMEDDEPTVRLDLERCWWLGTRWSCWRHAMEENPMKLIKTKRSMRFHLVRFGRAPIADSLINLAIALLNSFGKIVP